MMHGFVPGGRSEVELSVDARAKLLDWSLLLLS
jgi:hypothetical protein